MSYQSNCGGDCGYQGATCAFEPPTSGHYQSTNYDSNPLEEKYSEIKDHYTSDKEDEQNKLEDEEKQESLQDRFEPEKDYKKQDEEETIQIKAANQVFHENMHIEEIRSEESRKTTAKDSIEDAIKKASETH